MKLIYNNLIPFKGFKAINLFGLCFVRNGMKMSDKDINHESIHTAQMKELLYIPFYVAYFGEWIVRLFLKGNAYRNISFEREAYNNQNDLTYLNRRKHYGMWRKKD